MQVVIDIPQAVRATALSRATAEYNKGGTALTTAQFLQMVVDQNLDAYASMYTRPVITKYEFLNRFTSEERIGIRAAAASNAQLHDFMAMLDISEEVRLANPTTTGGVQFLEVVGLIAEGRSAEILMP